MPTIIPKDREDSQRLARALLDAAGDQPERVQTITPGGNLAFLVDDDLAAAVGTSDYVPDGEPVTEPVKKRAVRKPATAKQ